MQKQVIYYFNKDKKQNHLPVLQQILYKLKMNINNKLKTASSLSADSTQVRYQKALKEINKLIMLNTQLKEQMSKNQQYFNQFHEKMEYKNAELSQISEQKNNIQEQLINVIGQRNSLAKENQQLKRQLIKLRTHKIPNQSNSRRKESREIQFDFQKLIQSQKVIKQLQRVLQARQGTIKQLQRKAKMYENSKDNINDNKRLLTQNTRQNISNNEINHKLIVANEFIQKINQQNVDLKQKLYKAQSKNKLLSVKSMEVFNKYSPQPSPRNSIFSLQITRNSEQVLKRLHKLEEENKKYHKKMEQTKGLNHHLSEENAQLMKQNTKFKTQISSYQNLIEKQQEIIANLYQNYQSDINKMTQQFKQKLLDQRQNFSPAKSADHLKTIENLQTQNKALKKKFQLCSIQLTKCFKTLQVYKAKLSECQKDYEQLIIQREQLIDRLSRLQSSHRQKSIHSRGSASRIFLDNDRRNSIGQTGHFNIH